MDEGSLYVLNNGSLEASNLGVAGQYNRELVADFIAGGYAVGSLGKLLDGVDSSGC